MNMAQQLNITTFFPDFNAPDCHGDTNWFDFSETQGNEPHFQEETLRDFMIKEISFGLACFEMGNASANNLRRGLRGEVSFEENAADFLILKSKVKKTLSGKSDNVISNIFSWSLVKTYDHFSTIDREVFHTETLMSYYLSTLNHYLIINSYGSLVDEVPED